MLRNETFGAAMFDNTGVRGCRTWTTVPPACTSPESTPTGSLQGRRRSQGDDAKATDARDVPLHNEIVRLAATFADDKALPVELEFQGSGLRLPTDHSLKSFVPQPDLVASKMAAEIPRRPRMDVPLGRPCTGLAQVDELQPRRTEPDDP